MTQSHITASLQEKEKCRYSKSYLKGYTKLYYQQP